jgi:hypothetical protein
MAPPMISGLKSRALLERTPLEKALGAALASLERARRSGPFPYRSGGCARRVAAHCPAHSPTHALATRVPAVTAGTGGRSPSCRAHAKWRWTRMPLVLSTFSRS